MALCSAVGGGGGWTLINIYVLLGTRLEMLHFLVPTKLVGWLINFPKILQARLISVLFLFSWILDKPRIKQVVLGLKVLMSVMIVR